MHFLSQLVTKYNFYPILATATTNAVKTDPEITGMASLLTEYGVQVIIVAMMLFFMWKHMNNVIKRDNKLFEGVTPQLEAISKAISAMDANVSSLISSHNTHANQSMRALEKDQEDMRSLLLSEQDQIRNIASQLTVLNSSMEVLFHHVLSMSSGTYMMGRQLPKYTDVSAVDGDQMNEHYDIHPSESSNEDKK